MSNVGYGTWFEKSSNTVFVVKNVAKNGKRIKIFQYPIKNGLERDLMHIPWVSEADIRHSLLKGELLTKIRSGEAIITDSNIDLLQFDNTQKTFLENAGVLKGLEVVTSTADIPYIFKQGISLIGVKDGDNRVYTTPDKFVNGTLGNNTFKILIRHNGRDLVESKDYFLSESGGSGTGFDTILLTFSPTAKSTLIADYVVEA